ncbi:MAG: hypothetical protein C0617_00250 [Desulfuromonas sp.]|uniref:hypothetical protein n=1 Tax=Desulfuromonas sp. TaxID=892 RepID=UPI000CAF6A11|nr:hypothetical protein [Desulfuromonas sp.]PLX86677.1 MAG: hypothetical protein C0617_00250 [Desulfuromonas sp.]
MGIIIKPSDLQFRYPRKKETRERPKLKGKPDPNPFDRDDLYEVIPMFEAVMNALETIDGQVLHRMEEVLNEDVPLFVTSREEVFDCLLGTMEGILGACRRQAG